MLTVESHRAGRPIRREEGRVWGEGDGVQVDEGGSAGLFQKAHPAERVGIWEGHSLISGLLGSHLGNFGPARNK